MWDLILFATAIVVLLIVGCGVVFYWIAPIHYFAMGEPLWGWIHLVGSFVVTVLYVALLLAI